MAVVMNYWWVTQPVGVREMELSLKETENKIIVLIGTVQGEAWVKRGPLTLYWPVSSLEAFKHAISNYKTE
jgi:hypothetical protein